MRINNVRITSISNPEKNTSSVDITGIRDSRHLASVQKFVESTLGGDPVRDVPEGMKLVAYNTSYETDGDGTLTHTSWAELEPRG